MTDLSRIAEHMEVVSSDGEHIGTVDHIDGHRLKLTRTDPAAGGVHHFFHVDMIASVDDKVHLTRTGEQARDEWGV